MKTRRRDAGFSLAALIFFATAASILAAAVVPVYQMQARRERELELIFRGGEYTRAIQKYQRKFGVYPTSVDQLLSTNGLRFLRRAYKDPITEKDFRLIRLNPDGSLSGSKVFQQNVNNPQSLFGNTQIFGQQPGAQPQQPGAQPQQPGAQPQQSGAQPPGAQPQQPQQQFPQQQFSPQPQSPQPFGQPQTQPGQPGATSPFGAVIGGAGGTQQIGGGGLIGVASDSDDKSIMIYNQREKYSEWEFIAILGQGGPQGLRGQPGQPGQPPQQPGQVPTGQPGANPFGPQPGASPFGPQPGQFGQPNQPGQFGQPNQFGQPGQFGQPNQFGQPGQIPPQQRGPQQPFGFGNPPGQRQ
jgi:type II secretory pathway pseudopilin PulG